MFLNLDFDRLGKGEGPKDAKIVLVGEAYGAEEERVLKPFVGMAGGVLDQCLRAAGLVRSQLYVTNFLNSRPKGNDISPYFGNKGLTDKGNVAKETLLAELSTLKPNVIVSLGKVATYALTGRADITKIRGSILPGPNGVKIIPAIHPAAALRQYMMRYSIIHDFRKASRHSNFPDLKLPNRRLVVEMTFAEACQWLDIFVQQPEVSVDIEIVNHEVSCIAFSIDPLMAVSIPFYNAWTEEEECHLWRKVARIIENPAITKVGQNLIFDLTFLLLRNNIVYQGEIKDTMIAHHIMYPDFPKGLDFLTSVYTDEPYYKDEGKEWNNPKSWPDFRRYNAKDAACTLECARPIFKELADTGYQQTYDFTVRMFRPLIAMMTRGMKVNRAALDVTRVEITKKIDETQIELNKLCGRPLNVNSPKDCQQYFYIEKGIPPYFKTVTDGGVSEKRITTDDKAMQRLAKGTAARPGIREAKLVQELRAYKKLRGTYLEIQFDADDRMRCSYNPRGTTTGRLSSSATVFGTGTNYQNLPPEFRQFLVADDGYLLIELDKRQAEWVVVAFSSGDANMMRVIQEQKDPHTYTAHLITHLPEELIKMEDKIIGHTTDPTEISRLRATKFTPDAISLFHKARFLPRTMSCRQCGKKSNHGLNYDEGYRKFALINELEERESKLMVETYHEVYPGIRNTWHRKIKSQLERDRTIVNPFGRKRRFLDRWGDELFKAAYAFEPQSTVVDMLNQGMCEIYENQESLKKVENLAQVHDSLLVQHPLGDWNEIAQAAHDMRDKLTPQVSIDGREFKIETDMKIGLNWGDMMEVKFGATVQETAKNLEITFNKLH